MVPLSRGRRPPGRPGGRSGRARSRRRPAPSSSRGRRDGWRRRSRRRRTPAARRRPPGSGRPSRPRRGRRLRRPRGRRRSAPGSPSASWRAWSSPVQCERREPSAGTTTSTSSGRPPARPATSSVNAEEVDVPSLITRIRRFPSPAVRARVTGASSSEGCWCRRPTTTTTTTRAITAPMPKRIQPHAPASAVSMTRKITPRTTATIGMAMNSVRVFMRAQATRSCPPRASPGRAAPAATCRGACGRGAAASRRG